MTNTGARQYTHVQPYKGKAHYKINITALKSVLYDIQMASILIIFIGMVICFSIIFIDVCRYPEQYSTTAKYQLHNSIKAGDTEAIEYYNTTYINNDRNLFNK